MSDFKDLFGDWSPDEGDALPDEGYPSQERSSRNVPVREVSITNVVEEIYYPAGHAQGRAESQMWVQMRDSRGREFKIVMLRELGVSILAAIRGETPDRPASHDLMKNVIEKMGGNVERIVIDDLWRETYYAKIHIRLNHELLEVDARPSDAIAVGLRFRVPIFAAEAVLEAAENEEE